MLKYSGKRSWSAVDVTPDMDYTVTGLSEGVTYSIQVAAHNEIGVGAFAELKKPVVPKSQHSE